MASSSSRKQQIRPRYIDLAEFDEDEDGPGAQNVFSNWPPAATVVRKPAPPIKSSGLSQPAASPGTAHDARKTVVEEASDDEETATARKGDRGGNSKTVRFGHIDSPSGATQRQGEGKQSLPTAPGSFPISSSIIGGVQERHVGRKAPARTAPQRSKASRFAVARQMDEDLRRHDQARLKDQGLSSTSGESSAQKQAYSENIESVAAPESDPVATQSASAQSNADPLMNNAQEEWLDEDGRVMSAFRKSRLMRQGLRPPSTRKVQTEEESYPSYVPDPTRDPGGGADIDAITDVLTQASRENEAKLQHMSAREIKEEVSELESLFGKDVLEALRSRKKQPRKPATLPGGPKSTNTPSQDLDDHKHDPESIRRKYFPSEPGGARPELEWLLPQSPSEVTSNLPELRFDFRGNLLGESGQTDESYLSGLHHHGDNQSAPGYTFSELVHLTRSSVAAQRQLALNVLGRVCENYPAFPTSKQPDLEVDDPRTSVVDFLNSMANLPRARVVMLARWLLDDRNFSVRSAALRCLASVLRSIPSGLAPVPGSNLHLDWHRPQIEEYSAEEAQADASEVERSIQTDWAKTMLDSNILSLFLDQTDTVITSSWEAELALEILFRIATCSAFHALRVFGGSPDRICDFVIHLGLRFTRPPQDESTIDQTRRLDATPSLWALRLLHTGILADRKVAQSMIVSGSIDHLMRFIISPPWKPSVDSDPEESMCTKLHNYEVFDAVLAIYVSLASYGMYAALVARTWSLWLDAGDWAVSMIPNSNTEDIYNTDVKLAQIQRKVAASIFTLLASWTRCSQDPHQLMGDHDVTWTQVRDWINLADRVPSLLTDYVSQASNTNASGLLGAVCDFATSWLACALQKEPTMLTAKAGICLQIYTACRPIIRRAYRTSLQTMSVSVENFEIHQIDIAVRSLQALHKLAAILERISAGEATIAAPVDEQDREATVEDVAILTQKESLWTALNSAEATHTGTYAYRQTLMAFVADNVTQEIKDSKDTIRNLVIISRLDASYSTLVSNVLLGASKLFGEDDEAHILKPFFLECVGVRPDCLIAQPVHLPLSQVSTLYTNMATDTAHTTAKAKIDSKADEEEEDGPVEVDPMTGAQLWRCLASGFPLRADWPLLALDDLLHSASTAVFNRPDNLEADWQASELDIVRASLKLASKTFESHLKLYDTSVAGSRSAEALAALNRLPSAEQILLGIMKVFMLEKDQPDTFIDKRSPGAPKQQPSGALTGRDLFRDTVVSEYIGKLLDLADQLVCRRRDNAVDVFSKTTLEAWTARTVGSSMSFYQFFTDLMGLYDSVSFGDANFARVVMIANAGARTGIFEGHTGLAKDFRSLLWNDYRDCLKSMPEASCPSWLLQWHDQDKDMLEMYARFLVSVAGPTPAKQSIAYAVAVHHLRPIVEAYIAATQVTDMGVQVMVKSLLDACGPHILQDLLANQKSAVN